MKSKPKKGVPFSNIHEPGGFYGIPYNQRHLSVVDLNSIAEKIRTANGSKIRFREDYTPTNWKKAVRECLTNKEVTYFENGRKMIAYDTCSRIDAYRIASYYFPDVTIHQVYDYVETLLERGAIKFVMYCSIAKRYMFAKQY